VNAYFVVKVSRSSAVAKRFPATIIIANIITSLLTYFSIETLLLSLVSVKGNYTRIGGVGFWSFSEAPVSVGGSPIPTWVALLTNLPSYAFLLLVIVNACFIIKLLRSKDK
jgi:hypothetical protein